MGRFKAGKCGYCTNARKSILEHHQNLRQVLHQHLRHPLNIMICQLHRTTTKLIN
ncbi:unnamed protein product [Acanthoscelides obtectus]|uniref:Uncharacterized protein n=1 Tax=Acanthoscelides obtectus TaxID=200917 RepID=A0A9P0QEH8_ACAOB|nr:unnamed protein product [Acanthoscelides obtectus]CAK1681319.1 hypothetical protein AOBTE_LOCUS33104 [Acanthoscelides obtectus]